MLGGALGWVVVRVGVERVLRAAPRRCSWRRCSRPRRCSFPASACAPPGASRWLRLGPLSGNPAPFLIGATGLLVAAWSGTASSGGRRALAVASRPLALALALLAVLVLVAEPDFSAAAVALARDVRRARGRRRARAAAWCRRRSCC